MCHPAVILTLEMPMRTIVIAIAIVSLFPVDGETRQAKDRDSIRSLEPARYWVTISNDDKLDAWHRGMAIYFLFERHVSNGMTLADMAKALEGSKWIEKANVDRRQAVFGRMPFTVAPGDSVITILAFPNVDARKHNAESIGIWLNISGDISAQDFFSTVVGGKQTEFRNRKVLAWALSPEWNKMLKRIPN
jgi:hypothetical protein